MDMVTSSAWLNFSLVSSQLWSMVDIFQCNGTTVCVLAMQRYINIDIRVCIHITEPVGGMIVCERNIVIGGITQRVHMVSSVRIKQISSVIPWAMYPNRRQKMRMILLGGTNCLLICFVCIGVLNKCGNLKPIYSGGARLNINSTFIHTNY